MHPISRFPIDIWITGWLFKIPILKNESEILALENHFEYRNFLKILLVHLLISGLGRLRRAQAGTHSVDTTRHYGDEKPLSYLLPAALCLHNYLRYSIRRR
jgi:hypothetical protein